MLLQKWERIFLTNFLFKLETGLFCDSTNNKCTHIYSFPSHVQAWMMLCFWSLFAWVSPKDFLIRFLALGHITHINMSGCISSRKRKRKRPCAVVIICLYMVVSRPDANNIEPVLLTSKQQKCHVTFSTYMHGQSSPTLVKTRRGRLTGLLEKKAFHKCWCWVQQLQDL